jgi:hypothetical protein
LDDLSVWAKTATRIEAQRMAAFFSRTRFTQNTDSASPLFQSTTVTAATTGGYDLNTNFGNRPTRAPVGSLRSLTPEYHFTGAAPPDADWRTAFAENLVRDPMLARNLANRLWKAMFGVALVEPEDSLDPARLDPAKPPEDPGRLAPMQASHPELLERLAAELRAMNYDLREFLRLLADSSAYQLSSRYEGEFRQEHVQLFARHLPRRLEGEEIHDAIARATGVAGRYTVQDWAEPVEWAMLLPEPVEPRSNGAVATFMNAFLRGNRDTQFRSQSGSILQQLNLMNDNFVTSRTRVSASPTLRAVAAIPGNKEAVEELFLLFLSRRPSEYESERAVAMLAQGTTQALRNQRIEDLAWVLINKVEFIFSY